ncbi:MAG: hypothetical protein ACK4YP_03910, partial [Myxococcota bacterium]
MHLLLALLACSGDQADVKTLEPAPAPEVAPTEPVAPPPAAAPTGESRTFELDAPGGTGGAPDGAAFIVPGGTNAETTAGPLSDGSTGMKLVARASDRFSDRNNDKSRIAYGMEYSRIRNPTDARNAA